MIIIYRVIKTLSERQCKLLYMNIKINYKSVINDYEQVFNKKVERYNVHLI